MKQFSLEEYLADPTKKVVTRSGKDVRILCTDAKGDFPIIALIDELTDNCIYHSVYTKEGHVKPYDIPTRYDLFFAPEMHEGWVNVYRDSNNGHTTGAVFDSLEDAERVGEQKLFSYVTTIKIEWEE